MKTHKIKQMAAQGDVLFMKVKEVPKQAKEVPVPADRRLVVAHSETGHHHAIDGFNGRMFQEPGDILTCYLQMGTDVCDFTVQHHRPYDTHETLSLLGEPGDVWMVRRQKEHTPEGWRRVED